MARDCIRIYYITSHHFNLFNTNIVVFRHIIAAVDFNNNLHRDSRKHKDGSEQIKVVYPKFKNGEATVRNVKVKPNYGMQNLQRGYKGSAGEFNGNIVSPITGK